MMAAPAILDRDPVRPEPDDRPLLDAIRLAIERTDDSLMLFDGSTGEALTVPAPLVHVMHRAACLLARQQSVVVGIDTELSTQQAADLLNVSRPHFVNLLESGALPYTMTGTHRRVRLDDVMAYKDARGSNAREALRQLTELSQEMGLYGHPDR